MPLPSVSDSILIRELAALVTGGWQIHRQPRYEPKLKYLLELPPVRSRAGAFPQRVHDLLEMIDRALVDASEGEDADLDLLTGDQALGLRILFGTHPAYRTQTARERRASAAEYLGEPRRGAAPVTGDSLYKRRQAELLQLTLDCMRMRYGQDPPGTPHLTEVETVIAIIHFNELRRIERVRYHYRVRVRQDTIDRVYVRAEVPAGAEKKPTVEANTGLELRQVRIWTPGHISVSFSTPGPVRRGERLQFGFQLHYSYPEGTMPAEGGHFMHWEHNDYYRLTMRCYFKDRPVAVWKFFESLLSYPGREQDGTPVPVDTLGSARFDTAATYLRTATGLAWRWS